MYSFDRTSFESFKAEDKKSDLHYWTQKTLVERLHAAFYLNSVAYSFDPNDPPRMDETVFEKRKRS